MKLQFIDLTRFYRGKVVGYVSKNGRITFNTEASKLLENVDYVRLAIDKDEKVLKCVYMFPCKKEDTGSAKIGGRPVRGLGFGVVCDALKINYKIGGARFTVEETIIDNQTVYMLTYVSRK